MTISGSGADDHDRGRQSTSSERVFTITGALRPSDISGLTVAGGVSGSLGGNILVEIGSALTLRLARVTGGNANSGGGIAELAAR